MPQHTMDKHSSMLVVGLMTGTSLDGIDVAICDVSLDIAGVPHIELKAFEMIDYPIGFSAFIKQLLEAANWEDISYLHSHCLASMLMLFLKPHANIIFQMRKIETNRNARANGTASSVSDRKVRTQYRLYSSIG